MIIFFQHHKVLATLLIICFFLWIFSFDFSGTKRPFVYGVSFSKFHTNELKLDWKSTFLATLNDLGVRHFRFSAHWPLTEPHDGIFHFEELDFQMAQAKAKGADVIMAVGRRLPGWPECHMPDWVRALPKDKQQKKILEYISAVVNRYKSYGNILYWQVENEPYLGFFSRPLCGALDQGFLEQEIAMVRQLDPHHPIMLTDSGELSTWYGAYTHSDVFGTSMYLYIWNHTLGPLRYPIRPGFFNIKQNIVRLLGGQKKSIVIELAAEPWLLQPIVSTSFDIQFARMGSDKFQEVLNFSSKTSFDTFYLWGAEWWYWLKLHGYSDHWHIAKNLFSTSR